MLMLGKKPVSPLCMPYAGFEKATNCILEIPQNIKMTLENNVLTLKAGSIITLTGSTYATLTTNVDGSITLGNGSDNSFYIIMTGNPNAVTPAAIYPVNLSSSGDSNGFPTKNLTNVTTYYNTDDKIWYRYDPTTTLWSAQSKYPLGIIERKNNIWSFAKDSNGNDMIFNGAGFVGHHAFIYPGVKALIPNGFNEDGSYKTIEATTNSLSIHEMVLGTGAYGDGSRYFAISTSGNITGWDGYTIREKDEDFTNDNWLRQYIKESNKTYTWIGSEKQQMYETPFINYKCDINGLVTKFDVSQPLTKYRWVVKLIP